MNKTDTTMKVSKRVEDSALVGVINRMLNESFGETVNGNFVVIESRSKRAYVTVSTKPDALRDIVDAGYIPNIISGPKRIGEFLQNENGEYDGSIMLIDKKYRDEAREYSRLYQKSFSKEPDITFLDNISPCHARNLKKE